MHTIGFILEQGLGHRTHSLNLQANVPKDESIRPVWNLIEHQTSGWIARLPLLTSNWTLEAGWLTRRAIAKAERQVGLDALFFHTQVMAVLATKWIKRIPSIVSLDATPLQYDELGGAYNHRRGAHWLEDQKWRLNRNCFHHAQQIVAWSEWAKAGLVADYEVPAEKVTVIPPGIAVAEWQRQQPRSVNSGPVRILFVGGDLERKGGHELISVFQQLRSHLAERDAGPVLELHLVTKSALPPALTTADGAPSTPGLHVHREMQPNSTALKALFQQCDIFCLPTNGDCLPLSLIEASAAGLPSVTTQIGGTAEVVAEGQTGFRIRVGDQAALFDRLRWLIENPQLRLTLGERASTVAQQRFDAEKTTGQILALLKAAMPCPGR